ncbi:conserved hypothetical protein [Theileria equi strain WA]|uniref:SET domain-containing protein n=1 Tax=Theileria equi strain WA TaxID=1537102 RepID=L1LF62_THEEQ|nr:conserved hypothetical protein [Theileria equi strain WA]EKX73783.1 conserved hypothetical protein [Theileria equi strain WA]|eukprot:XP_004833235.1 conserved hypothetical protein [Theileria equi strain WA]
MSETSKDKVGICIPEDNNLADTHDCSQSDATDSSPSISSLVPYTNEQIDSFVEVSNVPGKGRCLFARREFDTGSLIFIEAPLFSIIPSSNSDIWSVLSSLHEDSPLALPPLWHQAALLSIINGTEESNAVLKNKWVLDPDQEVSQDVMRVLESLCIVDDTGEFFYNDVLIDPELYQLYLQVWPLNSFGRSTDPDGLVIYDRISFTAHSCDASCCWYHTDQDYFVLRARKRLLPGDEITISYLGESDLLAATYKRRELLENWHFFCQCNRCSESLDVSRGFLCKNCHFGSIFLIYNKGSKLVSAPCTLCRYRFSEAEITEYIDLERAYSYRIDCIDKSDLYDILQVYDHAKNVFKQHWLLYQLQTLLYDYYKGKGNFEQAKFYLLDRLSYADKTITGPLYCIAFMYEELADILTSLSNINEETLKIGNPSFDVGTLNMIMTYYFNAAALLAVLCGYNHPYYCSVVNCQTKRYQIEELVVFTLNNSTKTEDTNE